MPRGDNTDGPPVLPFTVRVVWIGPGPQPPGLVASFDGGAPRPVSARFNAYSGSHSVRVSAPGRGEATLPAWLPSYDSGWRELVVEVRERDLPLRALPTRQPLVRGEPSWRPGPVAMTLPTQPPRMSMAPDAAPVPADPRRRPLPRRPPLAEALSAAPETPASPPLASDLRPAPSPLVPLVPILPAGLPNDGAQASAGPAPLYLLGAMLLLGGVAWVALKDS